MLWDNLQIYLKTNLKHSTVQLSSSGWPLWDNWYYWLWSTETSPSNLSNVSPGIPNCQESHSGIFFDVLTTPALDYSILVDLVLVKGDVLSNERRKQLDSVHHSLSWSRSSAGFTEKRFIFDHKQQGRGRQTGWSSALVREKLPNSSRGISHMTNKYILTATAKIRDVWFRSTTK